jgi:DNA-directed RNA polymerase subunit alpha
MIQAWDFVDADILWSVEKQPSILDTPINSWDISVRCYNMLKNDGIRTIGELSEKTAEELLRAPNFGKVSLADIRQLLAEYGLTLKDN